ncbi:MAG TPA: tRNA (N(6)-L-threonylcarbamoyladenosine(37)-C(2))-methylthiotransferase MtaB [Alphaproteobacteria bacterium]|nr:tRNA (N(6)-L-threonylcarbamoyladenosine(37)-C(2))-methylthiotransferase MtaB [Alphaproteobacteria bacterium]
MTSPNSVQVITFGCRLNTYESEVMKKLALEAGLENTIIINTCAVTAEAERQARQQIRKLKKENPTVKILVTGCSAQTNPDQYAIMSEVDRIIGNDLKMKSSGYQFDESFVERVIVNDIMSVKETATHLISGFEDKVRAFLQVQNGCDHRCTFCIIPYGRGPSRSTPLGELVTQVNSLLDNGYQEIVLTGVDLTAYCLDLPGKPTLGSLCKRLLKLAPSLQRLRLSSLDPVEIDEDLWDLIATEKRLMPHLHVSLQAGDDLILKRMKRRHLRQDAIDFCKKAKNLRPDVVFGVDLIAGFPTETDEMFENTLKIVKEADLTYLHVFPYSPRSGTPAAKMPQVAKAVIKERAHRLRQKGQEALEAYFKKCLHQEQTVLVESVSPLENGGFEVFGKTDSFSPIKIVTLKDVQKASLLKVSPTCFDEKNLKGEL